MMGITAIHPSLQIMQYKLWSAPFKLPCTVVQKYLVDSFSLVYIKVTKEATVAHLRMLFSVNVQAKKPRALAHMYVVCTLP